MKKSPRLKLALLYFLSQTKYGLIYASVIFLMFFSTRTKGDASECYNCYSTDQEGCIEPYYGRYKYNSNILVPDCNYDMARNFHSSLMYVLTRDTHESKVTKLDEAYIGKWDRLSSLHSFYCCKAIFVVSVAGKKNRYVVRGCCCSPSAYDQCQETKAIIQNLSASAPKNMTYTLQHCSTCETDRCNSSSSFIIHGALAIICVIVVAMITVQSWCSVGTNKLES